MREMILINQAHKVMALFLEYLEIIFGAREDTRRIISSLEAIVIHADHLTVTAPAGGASFGGDQENFPAVAAQVRTQALTALSAAASTAALIQDNIPRVQEGSDQIKELAMNLSRGQLAAEQDDDRLRQALTKIKEMVRLVEEGAVQSVAAARALLPQVENLQKWMLALVPQADQGSSGNVKKAAAARPGVCLSLISRVH